MSIKLLMNHLKRAMLYSYAIYMGQLTYDKKIFHFRDEKQIQEYLKSKNK